VHLVDLAAAQGWHWAWSAFARLVDGGNVGTKKSRFSNEFRFETSLEVVTFAHTFLKQRVTGFTKDIEICLTPNKHDQQAYLPGLMACISFLDLLTGLYVGSLDTVRRKVLDNLQAFAVKFLAWIIHAT
jgi:hypothetical protein